MALAIFLSLNCQRPGSISKLRIIKPKRLEDQKASLDGKILDMIDEKLKELATKK